MGLMTISAELSKSATCLGCYVNAWIASAFPVVPLGVSSRSCSFVGIRFCKDTHRSMHFSDILTPARMRGHSRYGLTWLHGQQITAQKFGSGLPSGHHGGAYSAWTVQSSAINVPISFTFEMSFWAPWLMAKWSHPNEMKMEEKTAPKRPSHSVAILKRNTIYIHISMGHGIQRFPMFSRHQLVYDNFGYPRWTGKFNVGFFSLAWKNQMHFVPQKVGLLHPVPQMESIDPHKPRSISGGFRVSRKQKPHKPKQQTPLNQLSFWFLYSQKAS